MTEMNLLLVEDNAQDQESCQNAVNDLNEDGILKISLDIKSTVDEAIEALNTSYYDGAIIDLRLADEGDEGNQVIEKIKTTLRRIPVVIMTGTPDAAEQDGFALINLYKKGEVRYESIINELLGVFRTGLTKIMGGKGEIESKLSQIFINNLIPQRAKWIIYSEEDPARTEKALLRHALNHLMQVLDDDVGLCYPEELYIYPPVSCRISTGAIVKSKKSENFYIVLNPACDLAERHDGSCNTDRALLAKIDSEESYLLEQLEKRRIKNPDLKELSGNDKINLIKNLRRNQTFYYHWLPKTDFFCGGLINFRKVATHTQEDFESKFNVPLVQMSSPFLKDIVARFSSYYARQGQPDIDHDKLD